MTLTEKYGDFLTHLHWDDMPENVRQHALDLLADWIANAAAGFDSQIGQTLLRMAKLSSSKGTAVLLGNLQTIDPLSAALINSGASHALEFDDAHRAGLYHPGAPVIAAAWAAAGYRDFCGQQLICAIVAGYEISMRLAEAVNPGHYKIWHTTGTVGTFGAAASAARCLGLNGRQSSGALGLAGTQAAGLWEILADSAHVKGLHSGKAAHSGLMSALLAADGLFGPASILEGPRGFFAATVPDAVDINSCCSGLGTDWWLPKTTIKAYPVCGHTMTPIEAALKLSTVLQPDEIEEIEVRAHPLSVDIAGNPDPKTEAAAKFSIAYCVAAAICKGEVTQNEFSPEVITTGPIRQLLEKIRVVPDSQLKGMAGQRPAKVSVRLQDGRVLSEVADTRKGDPENPLTTTEKKKKFLTLVEGSWGREAGERIYQAIHDIPQCNSVQAWLQEAILPWSKRHGFNHRPVDKGK